MKFAQVIALLTPLVSASPLSPRWGVGGPGSLGGLAEAKGKKYFGTEVSSYYFADTKFSSTYRAQFNQVMLCERWHNKQALTLISQPAENEMKWEVIEPQRGQFNWTGSDLILETVKKTNSYFRGHNFVWDQQTPAYVTNITDPAELKAVLKEHIDAVMGRYGEYFYAFDVVNEPFNENGTVKSSVWFDVLGESYIETALTYAHAAAPNVKLYINDYNVEGINNKSDALYAMAQDFVSRGVPLHGVGLESHFIGGTVPTNITENMQRFSDLGLEAAVTELDVRVPVANDGTTNSTWLAIQAKDYAKVVQACLNVEGCPGVTVWGFGDYYSWIPGVFAGQGAACLYDLALNPKPAFTAVQAQLHG